MSSMPSIILPLPCPFFPLFIWKWINSMRFMVQRNTFDQNFTEVFTEDVPFSSVNYVFLKRSSLVFYWSSTLGKYCKMQEMWLTHWVYIRWFYRGTCTVPLRLWEITDKFKGFLCSVTYEMYPTMVSIILPSEGINANFH